MGAPHLAEVVLPVSGPFDAPGVFWFLGVRALDGVESYGVDDDGTLRFARTLTLAGGPGAFEVQATPSAAGWSVILRTEVPRPSDVAEVTERVRVMLGLDVDPLAVDSALSEDPVLAPLVAATPGIRVPGVVEPAEYVVRAIVGQQITVGAARNHLVRLVERLGTPYASSFEGLTTLFPSPEAIAAHVPVTTPGTPEASDPDRPLRLPARAVAAVVGASRALAEGALDLSPGTGPAEGRAALRALPGVGPWTAEYLAMRVLRDPDAWPIGDVALVAGAIAAGIPGLADLSPSRRHRELATRAADWAPWRSYAATHLWHAATLSRSARSTPSREDQP